MPSFVKNAPTYFAALNPDKGTARININCDDGFKLFIIFQNPPLPPAEFNTGTKIGVAFVDIAQYPYYLDLVRNEKPISVTFNPDFTPPIFTVHASEMVGEGEV